MANAERDTNYRPEDQSPRKHGIEDINSEPRAPERLEIIEPKEAEQELRKSIVGQEKAIRELATLAQKVRSGIRSPEGRPIDNIFLAGPSGVGKTESVLAFLKLFLGKDADPKDKIAKIDGGQFQAWHEISKLTGAPPGYKGHGETPGLFDPDTIINKYAVKYIDADGKENSFWIVLVDEVEKADGALQKALLSALDKGTMSLGNNKTASFGNAIFFFTSNLGNRELERRSVGFVGASPSPGKAFEKAYWGEFPPEFRGRMTKKIVYERLDEEALSKILDLAIDKIKKRFEARGTYLNIEPDDATRRHLLELGYNRSEGARALGRVIEKEILDKLILIGSAKLQGKIVHIKMGASNNLEFFIEGSVNVPQAEKPKNEPARNKAEIPRGVKISNEVWIGRMEAAVRGAGYTVGNSIAHESVLPYRQQIDWPPRFSIIDASQKEKRPGRSFFGRKKNRVKVLGEFGAEGDSWTIRVYGKENLEHMIALGGTLEKTMNGAPVKIILQKEESYYGGIEK